MDSLQTDLSPTVRGPFSKIADTIEIDRLNGSCVLYDDEHEIICSVPLAKVVGLLSELELKDLFLLNDL